MSRSRLGEKLWSDFIETLSQSGSLDSYESYYNTIVKWLDKNKYKFDLIILERYALDALLKIDPKKYIVNDDTLPSLQNELYRVKRIAPNKQDGIIMILKDILWDLTTIKVNKTCPNCKGIDIRLVRVKNRTTDEEKLILQCSDCIWEKDVTGNFVTDTNCCYMPANQEDIDRLNK